MYQLNEKTIERIYAGWLGKIIGIRLGAPVEGWSYEKIKNIYGEIWDYPVDYLEFAADDDSNGPIFLIRALEHSQKGEEITAQDVAEALLNYASYEHGFFWWGGYGVSTEHTAYLNLRNGIPAPQSGSIAMNGRTIAEQIGGQIFIDSWGLVSPGNPALAAKLAQTAASVTHDGNGIWGGIFVAVCISLAFEENSMEELLEKALTFIQSDCEYAEVVKKVIQFWKNDEKKDWHSCFHYIYENFGYDKYPGDCHIIPNAAIMILSLLYGEDDYTKTVCICNMCGWDTDCNAGNIGTIMGVRKGLEDIPYKKWRQPINDLLICSGSVGSLNIMDIPYGASYMAKYAFELAECELPDKWKEIIERHPESCHFEYPGSTHAMRVRTETYGDAQHLEYCINNSDEQAYTGERSLKLYACPIRAGQKLYLYQKTYYHKEELHDDRYEPAFSPLIYPGQTLCGNVYVPDKQTEVFAQMYVRDHHSSREIVGDRVLCRPGIWEHMEFQIPYLEGALLEEAGFLFTMTGNRDIEEFHVFVDDMKYSGAPDYTIDFEKEKKEIWSQMWSQTHYEITQFTKVKGWTWLENKWLHLTGTDFAETYTGSNRFSDYALKVVLRPIFGGCHYLNVRVQGACYSYAAGFHGKNKLALLKNTNGYQEKVVLDYSWELGKQYILIVCVKENEIKVSDESGLLISYTDMEQPYLQGAWGFSTQQGSHCSYTDILVTRIN